MLPVGKKLHLLHLYRPGNGHFACHHNLQQCQNWHSSTVTRLLREDT